MKKKILHIVNDEKFIESGIKLFDLTLLCENELAIVGRRKKTIHLEKFKNIHYIHPLLLMPGFEIKILQKYDGIIFHGLKGIKFNLLWKLNNPNIGWIGYGYDYYSIINSDRIDFLLDLTRNYVSSQRGENKSLLNKKKLLFFKLGLKGRLKQLKKVKLFNTVIEEDHYILDKAFGHIIPKYVDWNYPILNNYLLGKINSELNLGANLLLGNSNSKSNNHLDALKILSQINVSFFDKIVCPLSYGGNLKYKKVVKEQGYCLFPQKFKPLEKFYSVEEYFNILKNCSYYFSATLRQQAYGNILIMLYLGASVILFVQNPIYHFLLKKGLIIFSEKDLVNNQVRILTSSEKETNRRFVLNNYSEEILVHKTSGFIKNLLNM